NPDKSLSSKYLIGISIFFVFFGIGRLIYMIHDYFAPDELDIILWKIATIIVFSGFIFFIYTLETFVYTKTKRIFTLIGVFIIIMVIISELQLARYFIYAGNLILLIVPLMIYLILIKNATGVVRKRALLIIIGILIFGIGQGTALFELFGIMDKVTASIFAPPITLVGLVILGYGLISMSS
ncbi:MAG: hypothetical protein ACTSQG_10430, partial [Promethearchaeota archaeon]